MTGAGSRFGVTRTGLARLPFAMFRSGNARAASVNADSVELAFGSSETPEAARSGDGRGAKGRTRHGLRLAALAVAACMWLGAGTAGAGDRYLRAGIGLDRPGNTAFTDTDCASTSPAALYGCRTGGDGAPYRSVGEFGTAPTVEFGLGYTAVPVRFELLVEYRPHLLFKGRANFLAPGSREEVRARLSSVSGMLAGFVDLDGIGLPKPGPFAPFVGVGVGVAHARIGKTTMTFPATTTTVPGGSGTGPVWMVTAGLAMAVGDRATLDLAWRYTDAGKVRTGRGPGRVVWRDGSQEPRPLDLAPTEARLTSHGVRLSLRYAF